MSYLVSWEIDIQADEASSPREAAEQALAIQRDPSSLATNFIVVDEDDPEANPYHIDLEDN